MSKIVVTELPKRKKDCPFFEGYPENKCTIGGNCSHYEDASEHCDRLVSLKDSLK